ncbi:hypothetical protein [Chitinophaga sp. 22620]|uniref:hypothetical protein n=1 Tax=Chitinophaga sp. 22620 TaxID=3453952 RepID=UPI003F8617D3
MKQKKSAAGIVVISYEERVEGGFVLFPDLGAYAVANTGSFYGSLDEAGVFQFFVFCLSLNISDFVSFISIAILRLIV